MLKTSVLRKLPNNQNKQFSLKKTAETSSSFEICLKISNLFQDDNYEEKATLLIRDGINRFYNEDYIYQSFIHLLAKHLFIHQKIIIDDTKEFLTTTFSYTQLRLLLKQYRKETNVQHDLFTRTIIGLMFNGIIKSVLYNILVRKK
jgi:hypothetical protein